MSNISRQFVLLALGVTAIGAQEAPNAGNWKTWIISSGADHRVSDHLKT